MKSFEGADIEIQMVCRKLGYHSQETSSIYSPAMSQNYLKWLRPGPSNLPENLILKIV